MVHRGLHPLIEESADQRLLWPILLDGVVADADLEPSHPMILGFAQPLFKCANVVFTTKDVLDPAADHMGCIPGD